MANPEGLRGRALLLRRGTGPESGPGIQRAGGDRAGPARLPLSGAGSPLPRGRRVPPTRSLRLDGGGERPPAGGDRAGTQDHRPRRLRRRRRLCHGDRGRRPAGPGGLVRLAHPRQGRRRLRAHRGGRRCPGGAWHLPDPHGRLRDHRGWRCRPGEGARDGGDRHRPPPTGPRASRLPDPPSLPQRLPVLRALRRGGRLEADPGRCARQQGAIPPRRSATSTSSPWRRSPTSSRCWARTARWCGAGWSWRGAPGARGCGP